MTNAKKPAEERFVTFVPAVSFEGYPEDKKTKFLAGVESVPVPASYLDLLRAKGLVDDNPPAADDRKKETNDSQAVQPEGKS
ncbi:hypothetical protein HJC03_23395 [Rhizobium sp. NLR4b]|uniref:hypothetical protein n=2 Tax=Rhizobium TaxID=379 RepID=UPI001C83B86F|nr:hypothetical protein [Rhizobium sp. NLR4b]MBX5253317.1 hypothetical protein [Rhizobium sp. NLR4b]